MSQLRSVMMVVVLILCWSGTARGIQQDAIVFIDNGDDTSLRVGVSEAVCNTPDGDTGECISILLCPTLLAMTRLGPKHYDFLSRSRCDWDGNTPMVCCPTEPSTTLATEDCANFNMDLCEQVEYECCHDAQLTFHAVAASPAATTSPTITSSSTTTTLTSSSSNTTVTSTKNITPAFIDEEVCRNAFLPADKSSGCCGRTDNPRIIPGEMALLDQYPWLAIIEYQENRTQAIDTLCGGALISALFVLTAAHCLHYDYWKPQNVRLGDYDIDNVGRDCTAEFSGDMACNDGALTVPVATTVTHSEYVRNSRAQHNDIGLIKLLEMAPYTEFIRPICLPSSEDFRMDWDASTKLHIAGWGLVQYAEYRNSVKRQYKMSFVPDEACFPPYWRIDVRLNDGQLCADTNIHRDSCKGDSGGPLMLIEDQVAQVVGISSFTSCGRTRRAEVFTKVHYHLKWIRSLTYSLLM